MVFLDSNIIIYLSKGLLSVEDVFNEDTIYAVSVITYMEVLGYPFESKKEKAFIEDFFSFLKIIYIDEKISHKVIELKQKNKIKLPDAIICASAILNKSILITNDIRLKSIKNLDIKFLNAK